MRSLAARVRRVERAASKERPCPCGGPWRVTLFDNVEPPPHPCPRCGTYGKRIVLVNDPGPGAKGEGLTGAVA